MAVSDAPPSQGVSGAITPNENPLVTKAPPDVEKAYETTTSYDSASITISEPESEKTAEVESMVEVSKGKEFRMPTARELYKLLCPIIDEKAYSAIETKATLECLQSWAVQQNDGFRKDFVDVGGLRQLLFFLEDHIADGDYEEKTSALLLLKTLCESSQINETDHSSISPGRVNIARSTVDMGGVPLVLQLFESHALPMSRLAAGKSCDKNDSSETSPMESTLTTMDCLLGCGSNVAADDTVLSEKETSEMQRLEIALSSVEILIILIPCVGDKFLERIIDTLVRSISILSMNGEEGRKYERLMSAILACLATSSSAVSENVLIKSELSLTKKLVAATNRSMRAFPAHSMINKDGCLVLQTVCKHLSRTERKQLGVVASLGSVVASESIDPSIKEIADRILEEQFH